MDYESKYCKNCGEGLYSNSDKLKACIGVEGCYWIDFENPIPTAVTLVPIRGGILTIRRGIEPAKGRLGLPGGFIEKREQPYDGAKREVLEETGAIIEIERLIYEKNPNPQILNNIVHGYVGRYLGGELRAGDDAEEVVILPVKSLEELCFTSHQEIVRLWRDNDENFGLPIKL